MKLLLIFLFFLTVMLFSIAFFQRFASKENQMEKRINRYFFDVDKEEKVQRPKKARLQFNLDGMKEKVRKRFITKEKNNKLEVLLYRAGVPLKPEEYVIFQWISIALLAGILYLLVENIVMLLIGGILGYLLPRIILQNKQKKRLKAFNDDLPEMISSIVGALKAGFSFPQALQTASREAQSPMKEELETVLREMQYGTSMEDALNHLYERMPSDDLNIMNQAIIIQRQVGGNLATVLEKIVQTIRDRIKIQGQISTLTAQGRLSGMVIALLPVAIGGFLFLIQPEYIGRLFTHPLGIGLVIGAVVSCIIGFIFIRKITTIEV